MRPNGVVIPTALYGADNYYVVDTNEAGDITAIEREVYDDSFGGHDVWNAIAPWVDEGDYLACRETLDNRTYRILFDGKGGHVTEWWADRVRRRLTSARSCVLRCPDLVALEGLDRSRVKEVHRQRRRAAGMSGTRRHGDGARRAPIDLA